MSETGIIPGLPIAEYHKRAGLSKSQLDLLRDSPEVFKDFQDGRYVPEQTEAMRIGTFIHSLALENRTDFVIAPETIADESGKMIEWNGRKKVCRQWKWMQVLPVLTKSEAADVHALAYAVRYDPLAKQLLSSGQRELSLFVYDEGLSRTFKARPDWTGSDYFVDLKTTTDASTDGFGKEIYNRRYHVQAALYLRVAGWLGMPQTKFYFVAVQKSTPPRVNVRLLHESALDLGQNELDDDLKLLAECEASGNWFGYSGAKAKSIETIEKIDVPEWVHVQYAKRTMPALTMGGRQITPFQSDDVIP